MSHLVAKDLPAEPVVRRVRYRKVPEDLVPYLDTWDRSFFDWGRSAIDSTTDFFRLNRYDNDSGGFVVKPMPPRFTGRVWVLIGASNRPATFEFARAVKQNHLGVLVASHPEGIFAASMGAPFSFSACPTLASSSTFRSSASSLMEILRMPGWSRIFS
jgi:hypothetical protein